MAAIQTPTPTATEPILRLLHRQPVHVSLDTTLRVCAQVMAEESIGAVLVRGPHGPAGVLTERDVVVALSEGADADEDRARDFMTPDIDGVPEMTTIAEAGRRMLRNEIRHLAVTRDGRTVGVISSRDVLAVLAIG
ncbi:MAG TPA: CBS domain-containing protein [Acidimicrobiia bacterium]|nr:CBS domain-containing protein [Acidimicrobiia bacterium]